MRGNRGVLRSERGAALVLTVVAITTVLGFMALAIDLGMLFVARNDAQRAADAAALAGASAFLDNEGSYAVGPATNRAMEYALRNTFQNGPIDSSEVTIRVVPESLRVDVWIQRDSVQTMFARILGMRWVPIGAYAAAQAADAGSAKCLKPFAVPDIWHDENGDANLNRVWDTGETWAYGDSPGDLYSPYTGPGGATTETGYGSAWRNFTTPVTGDYGRPIKIKITDPQDAETPSPGIFLPWRLPYDPSQGTCTQGGGGGGGAATYRQNICTCNTTDIALNTPYEIEPGNMVGPTWQGVTELIDDDPGAYWDETTQSVKGSSFGSAWMNSPRIIKIALWAPGQIQKSGMQTIEFNNFALMFIEAQNQMKDPVTGRFLYYATGSGSGSGSLVKVLRLVK
ncbi:MAG: pilus assembly protein TadG-related protein [Gemmatimonadales bacterium]